MVYMFSTSPSALLCMAVQTETRKFKVAEFYKLGEVGILSEDDPVELLDGQIMIMAPIGENHRAVVDALAEILTDQRKARYRVGVQNPLRIDDENEPQPDLVLYNRDVVARHPTPAETFLVVEVADAPLGYDQQSKIPLYAVAGIKEVWIVDLVRNRIHTYRDPAPGKRAYAAVSSFDRLMWVSPREFPDIRIRLAELL
jgi:Uma2 family endonuclease